MADTPTLCQFYIGWHDTGEVSKDGLPVYTESVMVRLDRPPYLSVTRVATDEDIEANPEPYKFFQREQQARSTTEGYPLVMWPVINEFQLKMLAQRDIFTVEQLAKLAKRKDMPGEFIELAERAEKMISMQKDVGKFEKIIKEKDGEIAALREQVEDAGKTIMAQKQALDALRVKGAA